MKFFNHKSIASFEKIILFFINFFYFLREKNVIRILVYHNIDSKYYSKLRNQLKNLKKDWNFIDAQEFEDHITHWKVHTKAIQERTFKEECPLEYRKEMLEHIAVHEYLMIEKAQQNPLFQAKLAELPLFPIFPTGFVPESALQQQARVQGEANRGEEITGMIPGEDNSELPQQGDEE